MQLVAQPEDSEELSVEDKDEMLRLCAYCEIYSRAHLHVWSNCYIFPLDNDCGQFINYKCDISKIIYKHAHL